MHYMHQSRLNEIHSLPAAEGSPVQFWTGNSQHSIAARSESAWSVHESSGALVGEFAATDRGFSVVVDDGPADEQFDNWRSAVRNIVRRSVHPG
ncbi:MAG: hypothetical protein JWM49_1584 [Microbacteriaceae bacterium]|nr:hypothetical protein [Microbacteriaceae bacterium]